MSASFESLRLSSPVATNWDDDVASLVSSRDWIKVHGLKNSKLRLRQILPTVGFKHSDAFIKSLKKPISAKYSNGLFPKFKYHDGTIYNLVATKDKLHVIEEQLKKKILKFNTRLDWLTSGSRRIFGVIEEKCIGIVLDVQASSDSQFEMYLLSLVQVIKEQIFDKCQLNMFRCAEDLPQWNECAVDVNIATAESALDWLLSQTHSTNTSATTTLETILAAMKHPKLEAVYLYTEGDASATSKELLLRNMEDFGLPLNVVAFNCENEDTLSFLKEVSQVAKGRFHEFTMFDSTSAAKHESSKIEMRYNEDELIEIDGRKDSHVVTSESMAIWIEMDHARRTLAEVQAMIEDLEGMKKSTDTSSSATASSTIKGERQHLTAARNDLYVSSKEWIRYHGLKTKKLQFFDFIQSLSFQHCKDDLKAKGTHARYCDNFPHVRLRDGSMRHVHLSGLEHKAYEEKVKAAMNAYKQRLSWLQQGSRELFGTIVENKVILLIDTSSSMENRLHLVKEKLFNLLTEQLQHKIKFNLMKFDSRIQAWQDQLMPCTDINLNNARYWVKGLCAGGSTNTLGALRGALNDPEVEAIYLLTDGRPDQPPLSILAHVNYSRAIPIHTISFNCADTKANEFLHQLAAETGGRYHYFSEDGYDVDGPQAFESEDLKVIRLEIEKTADCLKRVADLRAECVQRDWTSDDHPTRRQAKKTAPAPGCNNPPPSRAPTKKTRPVPTEHLISGIGPKSPAKRSTAELSSSQSPIRRDSHESKESGVANGDAHDIEDKDPSALNDAARKSKASARPAKDSIKRWLQRNGLAAKRLRLVDVLGPTMVPHATKYVPVLDKHVSSKVFEEVLPIYHVTNGNAGSMSIVNPQALNLSLYKTRVKEAVTSFTSKLDAVVWNGLSEEEKSKYDDDGLHAFERNRESMMEDLELHGWPIKKKSIQLLEREIEVGKSCLREAEVLITRANELSKEYRDKKSKETKQVPSQNEVEIDSAAKRPLPSRGRASSRRLRNHRVVARSDLDGCYYSGLVRRSLNPSYVEVRLDNGELQRVSVRHVIVLGGSQPCPALKIGDFVLLKSIPLINSRAMGSIPRDDQYCYVPAIIAFTPLRQRSTIKCYTVERFDGKRLTCLRSEVIKISQSRYVFTCRSIEDALKALLSARRRSAVEVKDDLKEEPAREERSSSAASLSSRTSEMSPAASEHERCFTPRSDEAAPDRVRPASSRQDLRDIKADIASALDRQTKELIDQKEALAKIVEQFTESKKTDRGELERMLRRLQEQHTAQVNEELERRLRAHLKQQTEPDERNASAESAESETNDTEANRSDGSHVERTGNEEFGGLVTNDEEAADSEHDEDMEFFLEPRDVSPGMPSDDDNRNDASFVQKSPTPFDALDPDVKVFVGDQTEAVLLTKGAQGLLISRSAPEADPAVKQEHRPSDLVIGQEVLARAYEDGWYYPAIVHEDLGDSNYVVCDQHHTTETHARLDLISSHDNSHAVVKEGDNVVALYPTSEDVYAPGVTLCSDGDGLLRVKFFDTLEALLPRQDVYHVTPERYHEACAYILSCIKALIGQAIVARDDRSGNFQLGSVRSVTKDSRAFVIEWADRTKAVQSYRYIFGGHSRNTTPSPNEHVLALYDEAEFIYQLATVIESKGPSIIVVEFRNKLRKEIESLQTYKISRDLYKELARFRGKLST